MGGYAENTFLSILMWLQIARTFIYNGFPKLFLGFIVTDKPCFLAGAKLQDDVVTNF